MKTAIRLNRQYIIVLVSWLVLFQVVIVSDRSLAYVMSAEQLLYLMGANFSRFKSLVITQSTHLENRQGQEAELTLNEKIWLRAPGLYYVEPMDSPLDQRVEEAVISGREPGGDMVFRRLLMAQNLEARMSLLSDMGVDIDSVSFTRFEGTIVYQLGGKDPESPKLFIEKDSFLPIFFCYWSQNDWEQRVVTVRFGDYQKLGKGWYPFEIVYSNGQGAVERYLVHDLKINTPIDRSLSEIVIKKPLPREIVEESGETPEDKRLREVIDLLKEKYQ